MKIKNQNIINLLSSAIFVLLCTTCFSSCVSDELDSLFDMSEDGLIRINANIDVVSSTRSTDRYIEEGQIEGGVFNLMYQYNYTAGSSYYARADVTFGHPEAPEIGFATIEKNGKTKEMKWTDILYTREIKMVLTNIDPQYISSYGSSYIYLNTDGANASPFVMGPLDTKKGTNDMLCGQISTTYNAKEITAHLYHRMALTKVNIKVYPAEDGHMVKLDRAKVYITNITPKVSRLNTSNGTVYAKTGTASPMEMVIPNEIKWGKTESIDDPENPYEQYTTVDFVLPPQTLSTGTSHPRLVVEVPMEDVTGSDSHIGQIQTYSSDLPPVMFREDSQNPESEDGIGAAYTLQFLQGNRLNITAYINSPETELYFAPAKVENWVDKSSHNVTCDQSGIYNAEDFYKLIQAYQDHKESQIERYGYKMADGTYVFQLWGNLTLNKSKILEQMKSEISPEIPFVFHFNDFSVTVVDDIENDANEVLSGNFGQTSLYNIVTGSNKNSPQIASANDFKNVISAIESNNSTELSKYGYYYDYDNRWVFEFTGSFTVGIEDIFMKLDPASFSSPVVFNFNGQSVSVNFGNNKLLNISNYSNKSALNRLITQSSGVFDLTDYQFLKLMYNDYYPEFNDILLLFGSRKQNVETEEWVFPFMGVMTVQGDDFFGAMIPDANHPQFSIGGSPSTASVTLVGEGYNFELKPYSYSSYLTTYLKASGAMTSYTNLTSMASNYYNNNNIQYLWYYGRFDKNLDKWIFPVNFTHNSSNITYTAMFGKMIPDAFMGRKDYEFIISEGNSIRVSSIPSGSSTFINLSGSEGSDILYQITTGVYVPE